jgi:N-acetylmuramoyl-L-alanine amidase
VIGAILIALQLAASAPAPLSVRGPAGTATVPVIQTSSGAAIALDRLAPAAPVVVERRANDRWMVRIAGIDLELASHVPFVRVGESVHPLASAPSLRDGRLVVPLQMVADLLPRLAPGRVTYTHARRELQVTGSPGAAPPTAAKPTASAPPPSPAPTRPAPASSSAKTTARSAPRRRVVVDAGHGGPDRGMSGPIGTSWKIYETDLTLAVSKHLATALRQRGLDVVMTRTTDTLIALADRGRIANEQHGDLFISIHVNAANPSWKSPGGARGYETYFLAEARTEDARRVEQMENASVRFETEAQASRKDPLNFIINDMAQNEHLRESSELAAIIQERMGKVQPGPNRGVKQAGFVVLVTAYMPAVLVEIGFGTNPDEARFLNNDARQRELAAAIADAAVEYLDHYERRLGAPSR